MAIYRKIAAEFNIFFSHMEHGRTKTIVGPRKIFKPKSHIKQETERDSFGAMAC